MYITGDGFRRSLVHSSKMGTEAPKGDSGDGCGNYRGVKGGDPRTGPYLLAQVFQIIRMTQILKTNLKLVKLKSQHL